MKTQLFDYALPEELIAFHPPEQRDGGRLLVLDPADGAIDHSTISQLPEALPPNSLLVLNDTRVIWARLRSRRPTGGAVEILLIRQLEGSGDSCRWTALGRANKPLRIDDRLDLDGIGSRVTHRGDQGDIELLVEASELEFRAHIESHGEVPLPPYIKRKWQPQDKNRYQTVYARHEGSVAAPTAGLHFTDELLERLRETGVDIARLTLHVGPGTFRPINTDDTSTHRMDAEEYIIEPEVVSKIEKAKKEGRPVIAVGTTVTRALEGSFAANNGLKATSGFTDIFITPGFSFNVIDGLMTNFHLPKSTLMCLVSALAGRETILHAYAKAVEMRYRFYSFGDAMLILPKDR